MTALWAVVLAVLMLLNIGFGLNPTTTYPQINWSAAGLSFMAFLAVLLQEFMS